MDYTDIDSAVKWAGLYNLEDSEIPEQVNIRREEILKGNVIPQPLIIKSAVWLPKQSEENIYKPIILPSDIVYIELDTDVDSFLNRLEVG